MPIENIKKSRSIVVQGTPVTITNNHEQDYISLTDMVKNFEDSSALLSNGWKIKTQYYF